MTGQVSPSPSSRPTLLRTFKLVSRLPGLLIPFDLASMRWATSTTEGVHVTECAGFS
jgi:hypothetical protein